MTPSPTPLATPATQAACNAPSAAPHHHHTLFPLLLPAFRVAAIRQRVVAVAAANKHSAAITSGGEVFTWGANHEGQLGYGTSDSQSNPTPRLVEALKGRAIGRVSAAKRHTVVLSQEGEVFTWGHKVRGALRLGGRGPVPPPRRAARLSPAIAPPAQQAPGLWTCGPSQPEPEQRHQVQPGQPGVRLPSGCRPDPPPPPRQVVTPRRVPLAGTRDASSAGGAELRFHRGHAEVARPVAAAVAAGAAHTSVLTATGAVLAWRSDDAQLAVREVAGALAGGWRAQARRRRRRCWPPACARRLTAVISRLQRQQLSTGRASCLTDASPSACNFFSQNAPPTPDPGPWHCRQGGGQHIVRQDSHCLRH
jgi:hypothetical protein